MLSDSMNTYLSLRRAAGFKLDTVETYLQSYVDFATSRGDTHVVSTTVIDWATNARSDDARARRLDELIRFARFVRTEDSRHDIPPDHVFRKGRHRRTPYLLSDQEVARLLRETANLGPAGSLRPHTYRTIFGLLASTGLRISEALRLRFDDLAPDGLVIRETKFKKSRLVPLHGTVVEALDSYLERRRRCASADPHIFVSHRGGGRLHYDVVATTFQKIIEAAGIPDQTSSFAPRLHDLRHRFAVKSWKPVPIPAIALPAICWRSAPTWGMLAWRVPIGIWGSDHIGVKSAVCSGKPLSMRLSTGSLPIGQGPVRASRSDRKPDQ